MQNKEIKKFQKQIWDFYYSHKREFPWRNTHNPYRILVSEIMLQQTQTSRVVVKYQEFLKTFPTIKSLAESSTANLLRVWQGLGYNRRALNLRKAAQEIINKFNGKVPSEIDRLVHLPGIGKATAGAICAYAFNLPAPFIETNVRRVYIHFFFKDNQNVQDSDIYPLVEKTLDVKNPREWFYALTDYGNHLPKIVTNPNRQSKHYIKQSKFEGSSRQLRGKILKFLVVNEKTTIEKLKAEFKDYRIESTIKDLVDEGFLAIKNNKIIVK